MAFLVSISTKIKLYHLNYKNTIAIACWSHLAISAEADIFSIFCIALLSTMFKSKLFYVHKLCKIFTASECQAICNQPYRVWLHWLHVTHRKTDHSPKTAVMQGVQSTIYCNMVNPAIPFGHWTNSCIHLSVRPSIWVCGTYVVRHCNITELRCAPSTCVVQISLCRMQFSPSVCNM